MLVKKLLQRSNYLHLSSINTILIRKTQTNHDANHLIKNLYKHDDNSIPRETLVQQGLDIYHDLKHLPNHFVLSSVLKLFLHCNHPHKVLEIWSDIQNESFLEPQAASMTYSLWLQCCIESDDDIVDIKKIIEMLKFTQNHKNEHCKQIHIDSKHIQQLITKCEHDIKALYFIHSLIENQYFSSKKMDISVFNGLIKSYFKSGDIENASKIFNEIDEDLKDVMTINTFIGLLIEYQCYQYALDVYFKYYDIDKQKRDHVTDMLAIKAWQNLGKLRNEKEFKILQQMDNINAQELAMIDFYKTNMLQ